MTKFWIVCAAVVMMVGGATCVAPGGGVAEAAALVDTGPGGDPNDPAVGFGYVFNNFGLVSAQAGKFSVPSATTITSVEGWIATDAIFDNGMIAVTLLRDANGIPGASLFSQQFIPQFRDSVAHWEGVAGLTWPLSAGTYWVAFAAAPSFVGHMPGGVAHPLTGYASFASSSIPPLQWLSNSTVNMGFRINNPPPPPPPPPPPSGGVAKGLGADTPDCTTRTCGVGNPINVATGNKYESEVDYAGAGPFPLLFTRNYNSQSSTTGTLGSNWSHNFTATLQGTPSVPDNPGIVIQDASCVAVNVNTCPAVVANPGKPLPSACWKVDINGMAAASAGAFVSAASNINDGWYVPTQISFCDQWTGTVGNFLKYCQAKAGDSVTTSWSGSSMYSQSPTPGFDINSAIATLFSGNPDSAYSTVASTSAALTCPGEYHNPAVSATSIKAVRSDQKVFTFTLTNGFWGSDADVNAKITPITNNFGSITGWRYTTGLDEIETYDTNGRLLTRTNRAGLVQTFAYDSQGRLTSVTDPFGRQLRFAYDGQNRVSGMTEPIGGNYGYGYDANNNLASVTYPDGKTRRYLYENSAFPHALTGIIDENGARFATWGYDAQGRGISSQHAGGADLVTLDFSSVASGVVSVTDALGAVNRSTFEDILGVGRLDQVTRSCPGCSPIPAVADQLMTYDGNGNLASRTDYNGNRTTYLYDLSRNLEISRTEAAGTASARTITTAWHPGFRLPTTITEPNRVTTFSYDSIGNLIQRTVTATAGGQSRTWRFTYNGNSQVTQIDGPRTDVNDVTQFAYDTQGNLSSTTDALGHVTRITAYDANGRPLRIIDPNGRVTLLSYDARSRLLSRNVGGEITTYNYDGVGQLTELTRPNGSFVIFTYDAAHRLTQLTDNLGNRLAYTLDAMGNHLNEEAFDASSHRASTHSNIFDYLGRLGHSIGALNQTTTYQYDNNGNPTQLTDPLLNSAARFYDPLNRLIASTDPVGGLTDYAYDANDNLTSLTDPKGLVTQYVYDGLSNRITKSSPDTGITQNSYDSAGNAVSALDGRGMQTFYTYDALNRVTQINFAGGMPVRFTYDQGTNGIGRLVQMSDGAGTTSWSYDQQGRVIGKTQQTGKLLLATQYAYDASGQLVSIIYPSGRVIQLSYTNGQVTQLSADGVSLLSGIQYQPFGPADSWTWGNGVPYSRNFDLDSRLVQYPLGNRTRQVGYDAASRITDYVDTDISRDESFAYDALSRLTSFANGGGQETYEYDSNGNRLTLRQGALSDTYTYATNSNRLTDIRGFQSLTFDYDAAGNTVTDGSNQFSYDGRGRLVQVTNSQGVMQYPINGLGQRVAKLSNRRGGDATYFYYDEAGHLIGEYTANGRAIEETVYLGDTPVAVLVNKSSYFIYADHLNAPRAITNSRGNVVWQWEGKPFGETLPNEKPDGRGASFTYNLRFPGQYFDKETGLHYNGFRDYNPNTGRYIESDPIGLAGGINTYGYVLNGPTALTDPTGLETPSVTLNFPLTSNAYPDPHAGIVLGAAAGVGVVTVFVPVAILAEIGAIGFRGFITCARNPACRPLLFQLASLLGEKAEPWWEFIHKVDQILEIEEAQRLVESQNRSSCPIPEGYPGNPVIGWDNSKPYQTIMKNGVWISDPHPILVIQ